MAKLLAVLFAAALICVVAVMMSGRRLFPLGLVTLDAPAVVKEISQLNELVTVRYSVEKVVGMKEEKSPVGEESILLLVQGKVLAGIDLSALTANDVTIRSRDHVVIRLTQPRIQETFLDEKYTKVWDRRITWWTPWVSQDVDLEHKARMQAIIDIRNAALEMGILEQARRNAETSIRTLLQAFGMEKPVFDYSS
jgi:Protein of unknown function (DUF4230)